MPKPFLSVVIPAYNEAKRLPLTLLDIDRHLEKADYSSEILVVDDGSTDATVEIVSRFSNLIKNLKFISNKENHGKGWVVRQGMLQAKGTWRLFMDADNSTSVDQFNNMLPFIKEGYEVIIGSRDIKGAKLVPPQPFYKRILGRISRFMIHLVLLGYFPSILDSQCGFKCFREDAAHKIFSIARINRWGFDFEALALAKKFGYKIKEMPVRWVNDPYSHVKLTSYFKTFLDLLKVRWWLSRDKYNLT